MAKRKKIHLVENLAAKVGLGVVACTLALSCYSSAVAHPLNVRLTLMGAGIIKIEGHPYSDPHSLRAKLAELDARRPRPLLLIEPGPGMDQAALVPALALLRAVSPYRVSYFTKLR